MPVDAPYETMQKAVMQVVQNHFRPEFINRIDESVVFHPLLSSQIEKIAGIHIQALVARLKEKDINLEISKEALTYIGKIGFDHLFGARPLKRIIQQKIENPLAQWLLSGKAMPNSTIQIGIKAEQLTFQIV